MKKVQITSAIVLALALILMVIHFLGLSLSDWMVRIDGIIMLIGVAAVIYSTVRLRKE